MTEFLRGIGVVELVDDYYYKNPYNNTESECQAYKLNVDRYYRIYREVRYQEEILYEGMFLVDYPSYYWGERGEYSNVTENLHEDKLLFKYVEKSPEELYDWLTRDQIFVPDNIDIDEIKRSSIYINSPALFQFIDGISPETMTEIYLPEGLSEEDMSILAIYYKSKLLNIPAYQKALKEIDYISSCMPYEIRMHMDVKLKSHRNGAVSLKPSCRQWNPVCDIENRKLGRRDRLMLADGFDLQFDIHSAIFSVVKFLNYGIFDVDWDIKRKLLPDYDDRDEDERKQIKQALSRLFFSNDISHSYYGLRKKYGNGLVIDYKMYCRLNKGMREQIGAVEPYQGNVFLYESLWELTAIRKMLEKGLSVRNVYDCFYFKSTETTLSDVKEIITESINEIE